jgi:actin-like ATPase involved in cell morphogenesis
MNERIKQLAEQAGAIEAKNITNIPRALSLNGEEIEKFAELIVRECVEQILTGVRTNPPQAEPPEIVKILVRRIEQHFGVE